MTIESVSVVGLGKLGEPFALVLAARGFNVIGVDLSAEKVDALNAGFVTVMEPGLQGLLEQYGQRFIATTNGGAIVETDATFFLVSTPSRDDGGFSTIYLQSALESAAQQVSEAGKDYHLFIIGSTVSPGACVGEFSPLLHSYLDADQFGLCYCPELVALGDVVDGFLLPDFVAIGESDNQAGDLCAAIYYKACPDSPTVRLSLTEAEILKVALNFLLTTKISFANTLAEICEGHAGCDVDNISRALGHDHRIAAPFLRGGLAYGGFCFPRDVAAFAALCRDGGSCPFLADAVDGVNYRQNTRLFHKLRDLAPRSVSVLGLAFKPGTPEIEASPAVALVDSLLTAGVPVTVHDPMAMDKARQRFQYIDHVTYAADRRSAARASDVVVIATAWKEYRALRETDFQEGATVLDCWRILKHELGDSERVKYLAIGMG